MRTNTKFPQKPGCMINSRLPPPAAPRALGDFPASTYILPFSSALPIIAGFSALQHAVYFWLETFRQIPLPAPQIKRGWTLPSEENKADSEGAGERKEGVWEVECPKASKLALPHRASAKAGGSESLLGLEQGLRSSESPPGTAWSSGRALPGDQPAFDSCLCPRGTIPSSCRRA